MGDCVCRLAGHSLLSFSKIPSLMRTIVISVLSLLLAVTAFANDRFQRAMTIAERQLGTSHVILAKRTATYCIFSGKEQGGYAIVSVQGEGNPRLLAFSRESRWDEAVMPPAVLEWLEGLETLQPGCVVRRAADSLSRVDVAPLLTCHWHQRSPYNDLAPVIQDGQVKTVAGCVALAAAQVAYYWRNDNLEYTLRDTPTYEYGGAPVTEIVPKGSPNNWELMLDEYDSNSPAESRAAVAQLCYVLGTTAYLNYASSTGGSIRDVGNALYSQYRILSEYISRGDSLPDWEGMLYAQVAKGYPVICSGSGSGPSGHAFVLDGYDSENNLFHFNFGWGGDGDGYYPADESPEAMAGYYRGQAVLIDIHPQSTTIPSSVDVQHVAGGQAYGLYDMLGRRLSKAPSHGFYIIVDANGARKVR